MEKGDARGEKDEKRRKKVTFSRAWNAIEYVVVVVFILTVLVRVRREAGRGIKKGGGGRRRGLK